MPAKRSRSRGRSMIGYARAAARLQGRSVPRMTRKKGPRITGSHNFSRGVDMKTEEMNGLELDRQYTNKFNDMIAYGEFTNLFDYYRITKIQMTFQLITNPDSNSSLNGSSVSQTSNWYPKMWYVRDYDGGTAPTLSSIKECQGVKCRILQPNRTVRVSWKPAIKALIYKTATTEGYAAKRLKLDMSDVDLPHYGLNVVYDTNGINPDDSYPFKIAVETKIFFSCSGVR